MSEFKIKGVVQNYAWGGNTFIPELLGLPVTGENYAEYWMGAHDKAPSVVVETGQTINELIETDPSGILGHQVARTFGRLPFLFKVLDVKDMLSIQVHPTKIEAEKGFRAENQNNIPLSAPHRNYKDDNHKPEIMVALGEFWLLHGFKPADQLLDTLRNTPELSHLETDFLNLGYQGLYKKVMEESEEQTNETLSALIQRILPAYDRGDYDKSDPEFWAARAYKTFCTDEHFDKGIYSIFFFNILKLIKGNGVFQAAGLPHAYLEGQNIELMANSDNVLRGGLTPKHVDVPELLKHINFRETIPEILKGDVQSDGLELIYKDPSPDFELSKINLREGLDYKHQARTLEIILVYEGVVMLSSEEDKLSLQYGEVVAITNNTAYEIRSSEDAILFKAKCPT